jgi:hypothetical protein
MQSFRTQKAVIKNINICEYAEIIIICTATERLCVVDFSGALAFQKQNFKKLTKHRIAFQLHISGHALV